jgi:predicted ribosomally synthesized peptide with nif11-like leader
MSLEQLDSFVASARRDPELLRRLQNPVDPPELEEFLAWASQAGFQVEEADVIAAQQRAEADLSDDELQRRAGEEARRLRHFIHG